MSASYLDFDPSDHELIEESHNKCQAEADQGWPQPVGLTLLDVPAQIDLTALCSHFPVRA